MIIKHIPTDKRHVVTDDSIIEVVMLMNGWRRENCTFLYYDAPKNNVEKEDKNENA